MVRTLLAVQTDVPISILTCVLEVVVRGEKGYLHMLKSCVAPSITAADI